MRENSIQYTDNDYCVTKKIATDMRIVLNLNSHRVFLDNYIIDTHHEFTKRFTMFVVVWRELPCGERRNEIQDTLYSKPFVR